MAKKIVVVGASSGLGRCIGVALAKQGDDVALLARRRERLDDAAREAGGGTHAITCDVTDEQSCRTAISTAAEALGGIDALLYTPAVGALSHIEDITADTWIRTFQTNVIGASLVTSAALPYLVEGHGVAAYLSSVSASHTAPWPGLGSYVVSKAALERMIEVWRIEHPEVGFSRVIVGDTLGGEGPNSTEFTNNWDRDLANEFYRTWAKQGLLSGALLHIDEVVRIVTGVLHTGPSASVPSVTIAPRRPA